METNLYRIWRPGGEGIALRNLEWRALLNFLQKKCSQRIVYFDEITSSVDVDKFVWSRGKYRRRVRFSEKDRLQQARALRRLKRDLCL